MKLRIIKIMSDKDPRNNHLKRKLKLKFKSFVLTVSDNHMRVIKIHKHTTSGEFNLYV